MKTNHVPSEAEIKQAQADTKTVIESTEQMIDMSLMEFAKFLEGQNIGVLRGFRTLLQMHLDKADIMGAKLVTSKTTTFNEDGRVKLGSLFSVISRIMDRISYIDYLLEKNAIN